MRGSLHRSSVIVFLGEWFMLCNSHKLHQLLALTFFVLSFFFFFFLFFLCLIFGLYPLFINWESSIDCPPFSSCYIKLLCTYEHAQPLLMGHIRFNNILPKVAMSAITYCFLHYSLPSAYFICLTILTQIPRKDASWAPKPRVNFLELVSWYQYI